jgi:hypothetical protein
VAVPERAGAGPPEAAVRDCGSRGEGPAPISAALRPGDLRYGPVIVHPYPGWAKPLTTGNPLADWPYVLKMPLKLHAGTTVTLAIAPAATAFAALSFEAQWVPAVRFEACRASQPAFAYKGKVGPVTSFPMAIALKRRSACVPLELWLEGRPLPLRRMLPIGRPRC